MRDAITQILREFNVPMLIASENGMTIAEIAMAEEIARLRARVEGLEYGNSKAMAALAALSGVQQDAGPP